MISSDELTLPKVWFYIGGGGGGEGDIVFTMNMYFVSYFAYRYLL